MLFEIECDANGNGLGMVFMQNIRPIAYYRKALHGKNLVLLTYEKIDDGFGASSAKVAALPFGKKIPYANRPLKFEILEGTKNLYHTLKKMVSKASGL